MTMRRSRSSQACVRSTTQRLGRITNPPASANSGICGSANGSGSASGIVATARLTGQTLGAALAALCFALAGHNGAMLALALGAGFAALGSVMSFLRLAVGAERT